MRATLLIVCIVFATGCVAERTDGAFGEQTIADAGIAPDVGPVADIGFGDGPGAGTMSGTWLLAHQASNCVLNQEQVTNAFYLIEIEQNGATINESRVTCEMELSPVLGLRPIVPAVVRESITFVDVDDGYVSSPAEGGAYASSTEVALWGLDLEDARNDTMPVDETDPRVVDADGDGQPGVTFEIEGSECERWVAQRQIVSYQGIFVTPNLVEGGSLTITDSVLLGSSQPLCGIDALLTPNDRMSLFRMGRIDGAGGSLNADADGDGTVTCQEAAPFLGRAIELREPDAENCR